MKSAYFFNLSYRFFFLNSFSKFSKKTCVTNGEFYFSRQIKNGSKDFAFFNFPDPSKNILPHLIAEVCKEISFPKWLDISMQNPRDLCKSGPRNEGLFQSFSRWHMVNFVYKLGPGRALFKKDYVF